MPVRIPVPATLITVGTDAVPCWVVKLARPPEGVITGEVVEFTVMVNAIGEQPLAPLVVIWATIGLVPVFTAVKGSIFPDPLAGKPMDGLSFDQSYMHPVASKSISAVC